MPGVQAAGLVGPAQRLGAGQRGHAQQRRARQVGIAAVQEAGLGQHVEVGVGGEAVGAQGDADAAGEELAEGVRRVAEGGVRARAVDEAAVGGNRALRAEVVAVDEQRRVQAR